MKVVLVGYMASGKTIIANKLSDLMNLKHIDLDTYIEKKEKLKIAEIFKNKGEITFRLIENRWINELLSSEMDFVLSVGGGTPCYANNIEVIKNKSISFYLRANIETLYIRLINEKKMRPLVQNIDNDKLREFIAKHLFERNQFYNQALYTVDVNNKTVINIAKEILLQISN